jgi:hypothetical protein
MSDPRDLASPDDEPTPESRPGSFPAIGVDRTMEPNGRIEETPVSSPRPASSGREGDSGTDTVASQNRTGAAGERGE